jgi:hypothetical protein
VTTLKVAGLTRHPRYKEKYLDAGKDNPIHRKREKEDVLWERSFTNLGSPLPGKRGPHAKP